MRDDWGELHELEIVIATPEITDEELARQLEVSKITVVTHRRID